MKENRSKSGVNCVYYEKMGSKINLNFRVEISVHLHLIFRRIK